MTLEDFKDAYQDAPSLKKLSLLMETLSRRADAQAISATERWNENWEAEQHWTNEMRVASAKARWLHEELANVLITKDKQIHDLQQRQLAELKAAREPKLMTVDDFENNPDVDADGFLPCWVECNEQFLAESVRMGIIEEGEPLDGWAVVSKDVLQPGSANYSPNVRHWTSRPTDEQKEAKPWS